jgi:hypothetical protein
MKLLYCTAFISYYRLLESKLPNYIEGDRNALFVQIDTRPLKKALKSDLSSVNG